MEKLITAVAVKEPDNVTVLDAPNQLIEMRDTLDRLGFKVATKKLETAQKLAIAYAKYGFIPQEKVDKFNEKLRAETLRGDAGAREYKRLLFTPIDGYPKIPPQDALQRLEQAMNDNIFDTFEVATIQWIKEVIDPIIFGRIEGCPDRFFVAQWDDDVRIEDIVGA
jgi:hypothetical protein